MMNRHVAAVDRALATPDATAPTIVSLGDNEGGELRPPLALWIYVARGAGRIMLSVLALPFV